jgi:hypothetical protein
MKNRFPNKLNPQIIIAFAVLLIAFIVHSCKRDNSNNKQQTGVLNTALVNMAKQWYTATYPSTKNTGKLATESIGGGSNVWNQTFIPYWNKANTYTIDSLPYIELPALKRGDMAMSDQNVNPASFNFNKSQSLTSLIIVNKGDTFYMYAMTILADSSYLNGDYSKLAKNSYRYKDNNFSGRIFYHRMDGSFVNGWRFQNGVVTGTITLAAPGTPTGPVTQNKREPVRVAQQQSCQTTITVTLWEQCSYYVDDVNDENPFNCFKYTTQDSYTTCTPVSGPPGGGSAAPPPCTPPSGSGGSSSPPVEAARHSVRVADPNPPGSGTNPAGGIVDQTNEIGTNECKNPTTPADTTHDPCTQANPLKTNPKFVKMMDTLQSLKSVAGETTYLMMPDGTEKKQVDAANGGADLNFSMSYFTGSSGFLHNHGAGSGILSVFSADDIQTLYKIITQGHVSNPTSYTYAMVNQFGQGYLLVVSNLGDFNTWAATYAQSATGQNLFNSLYNNLVSANNSATTNEDNLVALLALTGSGLTLMKSNTTNTSWSLIVKNPDGTFSIVQCNN